MSQPFSQFQLTVSLAILTFLIVLIHPPQCFSAVNLPPDDQHSIDIYYYKTDGAISGPAAPKLSSSDYPRPNLPYPLSESRIIIWVLAQQHLYFASFLIGGLYWIVLLELFSMILKESEDYAFYNRFAHEILEIFMRIYLVVGMFGLVLFIALISLYSKLTKYLIALFNPFINLYVLLILILTFLFYVYYITWNKSKSPFLRWSHATLGIGIAFIATILMMIGDSWNSFMMSPAGIDYRGYFLGNYRHLLHSAIWNPINVHRFLGNLVFASSVLGAYSAYSAFKSTQLNDRAHYDRASLTTFMVAAFSLFAMPFAGYWLDREIYAYRVQMGITLHAGLLAWSFVLLATGVGLILVAANYYIWQRIETMKEGRRYQNQIKYLFFMLTVCFLIYVTPLGSVITAEELKALGGMLHPVVKNFGVESAKEAAINIAIVITMWSILLWWRTRYIVKQATPWIDSLLTGLFVAGGINIIWLGIYGYYIPANVRVGLTLAMVGTSLSLVVFGSSLTAIRNSNKISRTTAIWGTMSDRGYFSLIFISVISTWLMGLEGYVRSSVRLFWHIMELMRDNSPWAFTHPIGFAGNVITVNTIVFWLILISIFHFRRATKRNPL